jgi:hypothetical protein
MIDRNSHAKHRTAAHLRITAVLLPGTIFRWFLLSNAGKSIHGELAAAAIEFARDFF